MSFWRPGASTLTYRVAPAGGELMAVALAAEALERDDPRRGLTHVEVATAPDGPTSTEDGVLGQAIETPARDQPDPEPVKRFTVVLKDAVDRAATYRVVTPSPYMAVAFAALARARDQPGTSLKDVQIAETETEFTIAGSNLVDYWRLA